MKQKEFNNKMEDIAKKFIENVKANNNAYKLFIDDPECDHWPNEYRLEVIKSKEYKFLEKQEQDHIDKQIAKLDEEGFFDVVEEENYTGKHECRYCGMNSTTHYENNMWYCHSCNKKFRI